LEGILDWSPDNKKIFHLQARLGPEWTHYKNLEGSGFSSLRWSLAARFRIPKATPTYNDWPDYFSKELEDAAIPKNMTTYLTNNSDVRQDISNALNDPKVKTVHIIILVSPDRVAVDDKFRVSTENNDYELGDDRIDVAAIHTIAKDIIDNFNWPPGFPEGFIIRQRFLMLDIGELPPPEQ